MSLKNDMINELTNFAEHPENSFDCIIKSNKDLICKMSEKHLADIYSMRKHCLHLCIIIPYSRDEIGMLIETGEVSSFNKIAELENNFRIAESIFEKYRENK